MARRKVDAGTIFALRRAADDLLRAFKEASGVREFAVRALVHLALSELDDVPVGTSGAGG
ncbi:hypothetical protein [uncultured Cohaesibacter sp.]|uniref:hypothetical protein n=1 Tax=uncultured Cohaesibacter sp. TaxID=1002546 RepID=UPI0029C62ACE|nr:hypothetical protein [uncultured Cohaesibacter sp.]